MLPIAHRGLWWPHTVMENAPHALREAADAHYGIEVDVRLEFNALVVRHGPKDPPRTLSADSLPFIEALRHAPCILWDIKTLDAIGPLAEWIEYVGLTSTSILFDLELAGRKEWSAALEAGRGLPYLRRASETEDEPLVKALSDPLALGVWLDTWQREWIDASTIRAVHAAGKAAYVVSPELHQRPLDLTRWAEWHDADGICTDYPRLLEAIPWEPLRPTGWHAEAVHG